MIRKIKGHMGVIPEYSNAADRLKYLNDFNSSNTMFETFNNYVASVNFDTSKINLRESLIENLFNLKIITKKKFKCINYDLTRLHEIIDDSEMEQDITEINSVSKKFYEHDNDFLQNYNNLIKKFVKPLFNEKIYFQKKPTVRFIFPNKFIKNEKFRFHTDMMLGHPPKEINVWLSFTKTSLSNSLRILNFNDSMKSYDFCMKDFKNLAEKVQYDNDFYKNLKKNSRSLSLNYGEIFLFDSKCLHCTQHNKTKKTRISIDTRIITENDLKSLKRKYVGTGRRRTKFLPNYYYNKYPI